MSRPYIAPLRIGTRASPLALWQARHVSDALAHAHIPSTLIPMRTRGDRSTHKPLHAIGDSALFVKELEGALLNKTIDLAVHSAKDIPSVLGADFELVAFLPRADVADVLVTRHRNFSFNARYHIGTSAVRRVALLKRHYPHWRPFAIRGNVDTRLGLLQKGQSDAVILAAAAVARLGVPKNVYVHRLNPDIFPPAPGQGCLAIEVLSHQSDKWKQMLRQRLNHVPTEWAVRAERAFVATIAGGCSTPQYAWARWINAQLQLYAGVISPNGTKWSEAQHTDKKTNPDTLGVALGNKILQLGGQKLLNTL